MNLMTMSAADYQAFAERSVAGYARDIARTYGVPDALAFISASADFNELLEDGLDTEGHYFYRLCIGDDVEVGSLWIGIVENPPSPTRLFVYDLEIHPAFRRQGLGRQALSAVEAWAIERGIRRLELNVFADNHAARTLYETSGMAACEMTMGKNL
ncbi:GNAT family N-acetyltransferase [Pseudomonas petrae]|uniref:GNAT family N-acetyltransferase n=1 Tax=Pseudomonas petrae TaxID=2912190 RepID=A0ABS9I230_9PSED|nr:GNAT family N-acetyltransferase [Pseudomonas petrae]MCF7532561.1 GNAT family N-acetyltransferase [Pseudomonas petrae]MCF7536271.1 GNAT family N-acetyltransferase [Pseudomonas petrae]MCF7541585.1 GNAT family N-acetyltransferase [Pseudomonas petrae]MCF7557424.1 GNAT family N-acetyltransferase [Pseudomonas petrae]